MLSAFALLDSAAQTVKFSSATPEAGQPLSFEYDPKGGKLDMLANVKCVAQTFINLKQKPINIELTKVGSIYKGSFTPVDSTAIAVLSFSADGTREENAAGCYTLFYKDNKPTAMAYFWEYQFYSGMGNAYAGVKADKEKSIKALENAFAIDPEMRKTYLINYLSLQYGLDKTNGERMINEEIAAIKKSEIKEAELTKIASLYSISKRKAMADSVYNIVKAKYPHGNYAYNLSANAIYSEKDPVKMEEKLAALIKSFKLDLSKKADATKVVNFYSAIASAYGLAKNNAKFQEYANKVENKSSLAAIYNSYAWAGAEKKENLTFAAEISKKSLALVESAKNDPMPAYYASKEDYLKGLESTYASYADTYALLLDHLGKTKEALGFQEAAVTKNNFSSADMNARYVNFLAKAGEKDKTVNFAERFIKDGQGTEQMKADLKSAYTGAIPFDTYYAALEKDAIAKERAKFMKEMINSPAPKFSLVNLKGETISLEKLKGKVVIVDYWATWCGPCMASFPGMQKAVDKYKADPTVVFLFINTWQTEENREKVVKDWLATTSYTFNILLDTKNKDDQSKFDVIEQYKVDGIPTKFIVDGSGNIRFKKVGFSGTADGMVKELDMMIDLARGAGEASK